MTITEVYDDTYKEAISKGYVVLDLYGDHCGPCKAMAPFYNQVASDMAYIHFLKASIDRNPGLKEAYQINAVPTLLFIQDGKILERHTGALDTNGLHQHLAKLLYGVEGENHG